MKKFLEQFIEVLFVTSMMFLAVSNYLQSERIDRLDGRLTILENATRKD